MKIEIADKWVKALRSGEYKQAVGRLRTNEGFCCLGVLCDLHAKETRTKWDKLGYFSNHFYFGESKKLPYKVIKWAGINPDPKVALKFIPRTSLIYMNDGMSATFDQIADYIEGFWEEM